MEDHAYFELSKWLPESPRGWIEYSGAVLTLGAAVYTGLKWLMGKFAAFRPASAIYHSTLTAYELERALGLPKDLFHHEEGLGTRSIGRGIGRNAKCGGLHFLGASVAPYRNVGGKSGIAAYAIKGTSIEVMFRDGARYLYTDVSAGAECIERMRQLALQGVGLNSYISTVVKKRYASKC